MAISFGRFVGRYDEFFDTSLTNRDHESEIFPMKMCVPDVIRFLVIKQSQTKIEILGNRNFGKIEILENQNFDFKIKISTSKPKF